MTRLPYFEGDFIAIPLRDGSGYGVGRIARMAPGGRLLVGYFFGMKFRRPPSVSELEHLTATDACLIRQFADLGLMSGTWQALGGHETLDRRAWPMPNFGRRESLTGRAIRYEYPDDNPNARPREEHISSAELDRLPAAGIDGSGLLEMRLTRLLADTPAS
jgi:hypothetical protein